MWRAFSVFIETSMNRQGDIQIRIGCNVFVISIITLRLSWAGVLQPSLPVVSARLHRLHMLYLFQHHHGDGWTIQVCLLKLSRNRRNIGQDHRQTGKQQVTPISLFLNSSTHHWGEPNFRDYLPHSAFNSN